MKLRQLVLVAADLEAVVGQLTSTLATRAPAISDLVTVAGRTFAVIAAHASGVQQSIQRLPAALSG